MEADLLDGDLANQHIGTVALGIRNVLCVPLRLVRYVESQESVTENRRIGVLYLDSREKGTLLSADTRETLDTLAAEAAVAIDNAQLYRAALEKARLDQEMATAAQIQQALLPTRSRAGAFFDAAAEMLPCRSIGGDFFEYIDLPDGRFGFALGDVSGKGPAAALAWRLAAGKSGRADDHRLRSGRGVEPRQRGAGAPGGGSPFRDPVLRGTGAGRTAYLLQRRPQPTVSGRPRRRPGGWRPVAYRSDSSTTRRSRKRLSRWRRATSWSPSRTGCRRR